MTRTKTKAGPSDKRRQHTQPRPPDILRKSGRHEDKREKSEKREHEREIDHGKRGLLE